MVGENATVPDLDKAAAVAAAQAGSHSEPIESKVHAVLVTVITSRSSVFRCGI